MRRQASRIWPPALKSKPGSEGHLPIPLLCTSNGQVRTVAGCGRVLSINGVSVARLIGAFALPKPYFGKLVSSHHITVCAATPAALMRSLPLKRHCAICAIARKTNQNHTFTDDRIGKRLAHS